MGEMLMNVNLRTERGQELEFDLPAETCMQELLPIVASRIAEQLHNEYFLPKDADDEHFWGLRNETQGFNFEANDTLARRSTRAGDTLFLYRILGGRIRVVTSRNDAHQEGSKSRRRIRVISKPDES